MNTNLTNTDNSFLEFFEIKKEHIILFMFFLKNGNNVYKLSNKKLYEMFIGEIDSEEFELISDNIIENLQTYLHDLPVVIQIISDNFNKTDICGLYERSNLTNNLWLK